MTTQDCEDWNNYARIHVFMLCFVLMFLWILVFTSSLVSDASTSSRKVSFVNCISPRIRNTKCKVLFLLDVVVRLCPVIVHSICIPNSCTFHIAKTGLLRCCLYIAEALLTCVCALRVNICTLTVLAANQFAFMIDGVRPGIPIPALVLAFATLDKEARSTKVW